MIVNVDYLSHTEQVTIVRNSTNKKLWRAFYNFLCDYIPIESIDYSDSSMTFSWRHFLGAARYISQYRKAHSEELIIQYSEGALNKLSQANNSSYSRALEINPISKTEILNTLSSKGFTRPLTDNQLNNLEKISHLPGAATFSVPGAGKTTEALAYFFLNSDSTDRLLVVAPINAFGAWEEQLLECCLDTKDFFVRLRGGEETIAYELEKSPKYMIISYEQLIRVQQYISNTLASGNVFMFLDESHRIKGGKQAKRAETILELAHLPKQKLIMSGTPMPQSPRDLLSQFTFLYPEKYVVEDNVIEKIQPIYVRTTKAELGIPEVTHKVVTVLMPPLQKELYKSLKSETARQLNEMISDISNYELRRIGKCIIKVMQFVSNPSLLAMDMSFAYDQRVGEVLLNSEGPKIEYVCKRTRELTNQGRKVIIWSSFVRNVELIALRLRDLGAQYIHGGVDAGSEYDQDTREGKIKMFHDDPNCQVLVANPAACSEGISLHKVCHNAIYLDRSFNAAHYLQSEDRIHRLGLAADAKPYVEFVECDNSIDQVIRSRLNNKIERMAQALNDPSLKVAPSEFDYDDSDSEIEDALSSDDAKAVLEYFFNDGGNHD